MATGDHPLRLFRESRHWSIEDMASATGLSPRTILRAEQGHRLNPSSRRLLSAHLGASAEELGLIPRRTGRRNAPSPVGGQKLPEIDDVNRRAFLRSIGIAAAVAVSPLQDAGVDWERLEHPCQRYDPLAIDAHAAVNSILWQRLHDATPKSVVFGPAQAQLTRLLEALQEHHTEADHKRLCALLADILQLSGEMFFDADRYEEAAACYAAATAASKEAADFDLWACALTRHSFVAIFDGQFDQAITLLDRAHTLATRGDSSLSTRHWVSAVRAQAMAGKGLLGDCERGLEQARGVHSLPEPIHNGGWLRFDGSRLAEERGACLVRLGQPDKAEAALIEALTKPLSPRRHGLVLADLAEVAILRGELDQASGYGEATADLARRVGSGMLVRRLKALDSRLAQHSQERSVQRFRSRVRSLKARQR